MQEADRAKIRTFKSKIAAMLQERQRLADEQMSVTSPSELWASCCSYFDYMPALPEEFYAKLRLHTYHLTSDNYQKYTYPDPLTAAAGYLRDANRLARGLPSNCILNEPEGGIGFRYGDGRFISMDILRFQTVIRTLYLHGILPTPSDSLKERHRILEIGAGYGGLAHHLSNICRNTTYMIVDLPEVLLFSASYLSLLNPDKKICVYEEGGFPEFIQSEAPMSFDFVLVPNYRLDSLDRLRFDLVLNVASFQEMRTSQVEKYLDFIRKTCGGFFYSWNQDCSPFNHELSNLSDLLRERFDLTEVLDEPSESEEIGLKKRLKLKARDVSKAAAVRVGLSDRPKPHVPYRQWLCRPLPGTSVRSSSR